MADLLLELMSEEIPARMQARACDDLKRLMAAALKDASLDWDRMDAYATPRRLALVVDGLPTAQPDVREERRGPRVDAPDKAIEGFLKSAGISRDQAEQREEKKGTFLYAVIERAGRPTADVLAEAVPDMVHAFPWPKSQRWGAGSLRWVRPLQSILCLLDGDVVGFEIDGIASGNTTSGHRFVAPKAFSIKDFDGYLKSLLKAHVTLDPADRRARIAADAAALARKAGLELVADDALLDEVAGLVEWPVALIGTFDDSFLQVPAEVLTTAMRTHQKYFSLRDGGTGKLANRFICVANIDAADKGAAIVTGNERVLAARLADAKFFWDQDLKVPLEDRVADLDQIIFHDKLGSLGERVERIEKLAAHIAQTYLDGVDVAQVRRAARLAKADLVTEMVGEFPELQGLMGSYYAAAEREPAAVADAIRDHYAPKGPDDRCPTDPVAVAVALAEKIDTLVGFFGIDEKPTGSKDPFALRRAALGVIRLVVENDVRLALSKLFDAAMQFHRETGAVNGAGGDGGLVDFFADRLKVQQREKGVRHDLIDAVFSLGGEDDLVRLLARVDALTAFLASDDGANLLTAYKRAANILRIEEKKDATSYSGEPDVRHFDQPQETALFEKLGAARGEAEAAIQVEDFADAMAALAKLRGPVDAFFDEVTVNADDAGLRRNRLNLLSQIRATMDRVADFSKIEG